MESHASAVSQSVLHSMGISPGNSSNHSNPTQPQHKSPLAGSQANFASQTHQQRQQQQQQHQAQLQANLQKLDQLQQSRFNNNNHPKILMSNNIKQILQAQNNLQSSLANQPRNYSLSTSNLPTNIQLIHANNTHSTTNLSPNLPRNLATNLNSQTLNLTNSSTTNSFKMMPTLTSNKNVRLQRAPSTTSQVSHTSQHSYSSQTSASHPLSSNYNSATAQAAHTLANLTSLSSSTSSSHLTSSALNRKSSNFATLNLNVNRAGNSEGTATVSNLSRQNSRKTQESPNIILVEKIESSPLSKSSNMISNPQNLALSPSKSLSETSEQEESSQIQETSKQLPQIRTEEELQQAISQPRNLSHREDTSTPESETETNNVFSFTKRDPEIANFKTSQTRNNAYDELDINDGERRDLVVDTSLEEKKPQKRRKHSSGQKRKKISSLESEHKIQEEEAVDINANRFTSTDNQLFKKTAKLEQNHLSSDEDICPAKFARQIKLEDKKVVPSGKKSEKLKNPKPSQNLSRQTKIQPQQQPERVSRRSKSKICYRDYQEEDLMMVDYCVQIEDYKTKYPDYVEPKLNSTSSSESDSGENSEVLETQKPDTSVRQVPNNQSSQEPQPATSQTKSNIFDNPKNTWRQVIENLGLNKPKVNESKPQQKLMEYSSQDSLEVQLSQSYCLVPTRIIKEESKPETLEIQEKIENQKSEPDIYLKMELQKETLSSDHKPDLPKNSTKKPETSSEDSLDNLPKCKSFQLPKVTVSKSNKIEYETTVNNDPLITYDLNSIKDLFICKLCKGYMVDTVIISNCHHRFCKSCIIIGWVWAIASYFKISGTLQDSWGIKEALPEIFRDLQKNVSHV